MKHATRNIIIAAALATLGLAAGAQTQPMPSGPGPHQGPSTQRDGQRGEGRMQQRMQERVAKRMAEFKRALQITPAQEAAWTGWTSAMQPAARQRPDRAEFMRLTTPERIDRMRAMRAARNTEMDRRAEATKTFYGALSAEQKRVFDTASMRFMGERGGRGGRHGEHHRA